MKPTFSLTGLLASDTPFSSALRSIKLKSFCIETGGGTPSAFAAAQQPASP
eukprot:CAMPEP_0177795810 /NCGR_PEP_ID=MMETSP0491_2-20121128/26442_1 /TAXON_ID=63592 /ORGANISM="Tetraselmis chuii, Strain PLY429" /LENGTH=50 /DNA_ID=CAMNT_0019318687 /DNA_START=620 /DNA_END=772 /DNA_ORIENTATION=+